MIALFAVINLGFLFFVSYKIWLRQDTSIRKFFWPALLLKLVAGIFLGLIYTYYYTAGDTFIYFKDGQTLAEVAREDVSTYIRFLWAGDDSFAVWNKLHLSQARALFMAKITSVVNLVSHNNYWITSLYFSFISFITSWILVKIIVKLYPSLLNGAVIGFLFFPSAVFWSSGLIKESLATASLFLLTSYFLKAWGREFPRVWEWIVIVICLWLVWSLKYYFLVVFLPVTCACLVVKLIFPERLKQLPVMYSLLLWGVIFLLPIIAVSFIRPNFYPDRFFHVIVSNYSEFHAISAPDDLIFYHNLQPTLFSIIRNSPWALISGLYRPVFAEANTLFKLAISLENLVLIILSIGALWNVKRMFFSPARMLLFALIVYVGFLAVFLALSTPNFGTLSRYRVAFLPFFFLLLSIENPILGWVTRLRQRSSDHLVP